MKTLLSAFFITVMFSGCATILKGSQSSIYVTSTPPGAKIFVDGGFVGTAPTKITVVSDSPFTLTAKIEGREDTSARMTPSTGGGWVVADVLLTGLLGVIVDGTTGSWKSHDRTLHVELADRAPASTNKETH